MRCWRRHFLERAREAGLGAKVLDQGAVDELRRYRWPGNVRELENLMRRLAALTPQEVITADIVAAELADRPDEESDAPGGGAASLGQAVERHIRAMLAGSSDGIPYARRV